MGENTHTYTYLSQCLSVCGLTVLSLCVRSVIIWRTGFQMMFLFHTMRWRTRVGRATDTPTFRTEPLIHWAHWLFCSHWLYRLSSHWQLYRLLNTAVDCMYIHIVCLWLLIKSENLSFKCQDVFHISSLCSHKHQIVIVDCLNVLTACFLSDFNGFLQVDFTKNNQKPLTYKSVIYHNEDSGTVVTMSV